jgi:hypothetical protein
VPLDPKLEAIFSAWYEYDHAPDEQTKALRGAHRDGLIRAALLPHDLRIVDFLRTYRDDYRKWLIDSKLDLRFRRRRF